MSFNIDKKYLDNRIRYYRKKNREAEKIRLSEVTDSVTKGYYLELQFEYKAVIKELQYLKRKLQ